VPIPISSRGILLGRVPMIPSSPSRPLGPTSPCPPASNGSTTPVQITRRNGRAAERQDERTKDGRKNTETPSMAPPTDPHLKKKTSFRDRLKWPAGKSTSTSQPTQGETATSTKKRAAYKPKHAASDFSRLAGPVVPRRITSLAPQDKHVLSTTPPKIAPPEHQSPKPPVRSNHQDRTERVTRSEALPPSYEQAKPVPRVEERSSRTTLRETKRPSLKPSMLSLPKLPAQQNTFSDGPWAAAQAAVPIPITPIPIAWTPGAAESAQSNLLRTRSRDLPPHLAQTKSREPPSHLQPTKSRDLPPQTTTTEQRSPNTSSAPPSDFELFLARAEAEDRAQREQVWQTLTQRSCAAAAAPMPIVRPNPHRQFASNSNKASTGNGTGANTGTHNLTHRSSAQYILGGTGAGAREQDSPRNTPGPDERRGSVTRRGSYAVTPKGSRQALKDKSSMQSIAVYSVHDEKEKGVVSEGERVRTLRRESSLTQRIVEYIRPPMDQGLYHSASRTSMRRTGAQGGVGRTIFEQVDE